jgi:leucyl-tRNA synthetase
MMKRYNPKELEPKWQKKWTEADLYKVEQDSSKPKRYVLEYFPYPSGAAMHVGHARNYSIGDVVARFYRMNGFNVLHPMGWDAFGLPAENYAIKTGISPQKTIKESTAKFKQQLTQLGCSYDWSREINSSNPKYYKWTQWFFKLLYERNLAYQDESLQWWCETDQTVLANEQVENGKCWRCGNTVVKKPLKQWFLKITDYADRLQADLDNLDWSDAIKAMQKNWIGKSYGAEIKFQIAPNSELRTPESIKIFTTRPDTLFGATFMVMAPENPMLSEITTKENQEKVQKYIKQAEAKTDIDRMETDRAKTGVFTGSYVINPATNKKIPIWVADYVLMGYGTGAIMAVPAHDERDFEFAKKFDLEVIEVISKPKGFKDCYTGEGKLVNSGKYNNMPSAQAREKIVADLAKKKLAKEKVNYRMRDWLISRQRYWGAPIPIIHCPKCGPVAVPDKDLPVKLPEVKDYKPRSDGKSVLESVDTWANTTCPKCGHAAKRETDTMDGFACSSWYFLRFADPHNDKNAFDKSKADYWLPVDDYIGGAEHAVMHLLYARFWTKVMHDAKLIDFDEPFTSLRNQGMILAPDGRKMSKSYGNTITPDEIIGQGYGADSIRLMELFIGPWDQEASWSVEGLGGVFRFLQRVWAITHKFIDTKKPQDNPELEGEVLTATHSAIKKVSGDIKNMNFNTAIAALMDFTNQLYKIEAKNGFKAVKAWAFALDTLQQLLAPFAPHIAEELWHELGHKTSVHLSDWPTHDEAYLIKDVIKIAVQVNGKLRGEIEVPSGVTQEVVEAEAVKNKKVAKALTGNVKKVIYIEGKIINFVV